MNFSTSRATTALAVMTAMFAFSAEAFAQAFPQAQPGGGGNPVCQRLEAQLTALDRGASDPGRADQIRRYEEAASRQQSELDRTVAQARRQGCEGSGFFNLFGGQPQQCGGLNNQIQQMRDNLDRIMGDLQKLQGASANYERDGQRRAILTALGRNDCGPQYRQAAQQQGRGLFETLFGNNSFAPGVGSGSTFRTVCVRTCDGYYWPISFSTTQDHFRDDEMKCQKMCPAAEVALFSHRNPGEDMAQATSVGGRLYTELPNAFKYRQQIDQACSCRRPGESWAEAMKNIETRSSLEQGDILVTEERAKTMSLPRDAQGRPIRPAATPASASAPVAAAATTAPATPAQEPAPASSEPKKPVRSVGPQFIPAR
jgi:hypothetical protein